MSKYYCKQVPPEHQEDDLFWVGRNKNNRSQLHWNDETYENDVIIYGNNDFLEYYTDAYEKVRKIDDILYEYESTSNPHSNGCYWDNVSQLINYYLAKENDKKYTTKEIHEWKKLLDNWYKEENVEKALQLITGKKWREACIKGCCQREWQYLYVSEDITDKDIEYIGMCYFNTGEEWLVYENKEEFDNDDYAYSLYIDGWNVKSNLAERIGCNEEDIVCLEFDGWSRSPKYKEI